MKVIFKLEWIRVPLKIQVLIKPPSHSTKLPNNVNQVAGYKLGSIAMKWVKQAIRKADARKIGFL
jgi:hypothetical protein